MAILDRLWHWLSGQNAPTPRHAAAPRSQHQASHIAPRGESKKITVTPKPEPDQTVSEPQHQQPAQASVPSTTTDAVLVVLYLGEDGRSLADPEWLNGHIGDPIHLQFKNFEDKILINIKGFLTSYTSPYHIMTLQFMQKLGHPVVLYPVDYDTGQLLQTPHVITGQINAPFALKQPDIEDYHLIKASRPLNGHFTTEPQMIIVMLRRNTWQSVQRINYYLELNQTTVVYDAPNGQIQPYDFPDHSVWRAFIKVTLSDGQTWYNLGGPQWIINDKIVVTDRPAASALESETALEQPKFDPMNKSGQIDFIADHSVNIFNAPNGQIMGHIPDGTLVMVTGKLVDDAKIPWYELDHKEVIQAQYVRLMNVQMV
ncbi:hypothetical protein AYR62_07875 [Secundilactobacillus paracollinoides]|uniref:MucBP domain-containing protein n=1 Tax=Secundilactobacillus paracollinoides TaxID=240427 RepID=A0A1B2J1T8_9LACO|nr:MucBP domain-containing protein [Secundilactobacillus paracollinoides]ANZ62313.1 hypothetical protein AYR61_13895 [Secundilactobacillus paracollinoides]ANZ64001.1 hypothetical protein AYR62_07875 [Secundilactobacillus paracollinoides]ANZ68261.1 hypothetical protein AYR63_14770 [Secundilactobacillus paracollinoides]KRL78977.1 hypothetical protein FC17_GL000768 [Secundilactobacillus paracollinoides DSM 15502 = JCM 11969]